MSVCTQLQTQGCGDGGVGGGPKEHPGKGTKLGILAKKKKTQKQKTYNFLSYNVETKGRKEK